MKQITVRGVPEELGRRLEGVSKARGKSLNATVLELLAKAVGLGDRRAWLERFTTWGPEEVDELDRASRAQRAIDAKLWK
jgi:plasmid stability protein